MKRLFAGLIALLSGAAFGATLVPVQLLSPAGSTSGQAIVSSGASTAPAWTAIVNSVAGQTGAVTLTGIGLGSGATPTFFGLTLNGSTAHGVVVGGGNGVPLTFTAAGAAGQPLLSGGASADPSYGTLAVANGGTGATSAAGARTNLGAAASGANADITSLSGLSTPLSVAQGGTGAATSTGSGAVVLATSPALTTPNIGVASGTSLAVSGSANTLTIVGSATGVRPSITATGSDTNVGIAYVAKGSTTITFGNASGNWFSVTGPTTPANFTQVVGAASGGDAGVNAAGADTNVNLGLTPKGTGVVKVTSGGLLLPITTVGALATCNAGLKGTLYAVSDAAAISYNATASGGSSGVVPVFCNGTNWTYH